MNNAETTKKFFSVTDVETKSAILTNIASHYGISQDAALAEVTDDEAEHLLDYVTGPMRAGVSIVMQRHGLK